MPGKIETWSTDKVVPYQGNPRLHSKVEVDALAEAIRQFGFNKPIEVDETGVILCGHRRLAASVALGLDVVPVLQHFHLSETDKRAYRIADNRLSLDGEWEMSLLATEVDALADAGVDLEMTGFGEGEVEKLVADWKDESRATDPPPVEPSEDPKTRPGDLWILGKHRLLCGDATSSEDMSRLLAGERPRLCITDPPYGVEYDPEWRNEAAEKGLINYSLRSVGKVINDDRSDWVAVWKLIPSEVLYCWYSALFVTRAQAGIESAGFEVRSEIIWAKPRFAISRGHYHWQHESCMYAVRKGSDAGWVGDRSQTTLWETPLDANVAGGHSTHKPVALMYKAMANHSGDVVEPFCGSGATIIAAERLHRRCFAMEIDPGYCDATVQRWEEATGKKAVLEAPEVVAI